jgi:anti-sigma B factor antagonist
MDIKIEKNGVVQVVSINGELDSTTTPAAQEKIIVLAVPGARILMDMSQVQYMSSAGLRMFLLMYRTFVGKGGKVVLVGLSSDLSDTMSMTGFLDFFTCVPSFEEGMAFLNA